MNAIQRRIELARTACLNFVNSQFDELLTIVKANAEFLDEMNATNATYDPANGEYVATMIVEAPPSIPNLEDVKPLSDIENHIEEVIERLGLEANPTENKKLIDPELWERLVKTFVNLEM